MAGPFDHLPSASDSSPFAHLPSASDTEATQNPEEAASPFEAARNKQEGIFNRGLAQKQLSDQAASKAQRDTLAAQQAAAPQSGLGNFAASAFKQLSSAVENPMQRLYSAVGQPGFEGPETRPNEAQQRIAQTQAQLNQQIPTDPTRLSGHLGATAANLAPALLSGPAAPAVMAAQGLENRQEEVENARQQGVNISGGQQAAYLGGGAVLDAATGLLIPGGRVSKSLMGELPAVANPILNAGKNALIGGAVSAPEMGLYQTASNALQMGTGVQTPEQQAQPWQQQISQGVPEASLTGGVLGAGGHLLHPPGTAPKAQPEAQAAPYDLGPGSEAQQIKEMEARMAQVSRTPPEQKTAKAEAHPEAETALKEGGHMFEPVTEAHPEVSAKLENFQPVERRVAEQHPVNPEDERRFEELTKQATTESPEEANPNIKPQPRAANVADEAARENYRNPESPEYTENLKNIAESRKNIFQEASAKAGPKASSEIQGVADSYAEKAGLPSRRNTEYAKVDPEQASKIAAAYDAMKHDPDDPKVKASYDAFKTETLEQYRHLKDAGYTFTGEEQAPHRSSQEVLEDLQDNKHLRVFTGGDMPADHPLAEAAPANEDGLKTYNNIFRAVHDVFGHGKEGYGFGPRGEENAWRQHVQMYSPEAQGAMTTETRGQNSWVNFGPQGEANRANPAQTKYAEQKAGLLPEEHTSLGEKAKGLAARLLSEEHGGETPSPFVKHDVIPTLKNSAEAVSDAVRGIRRIFGGQTGEAADITKATLKARGSELAQRTDQVSDQIGKMERLTAKLPVDEQRAITHSAETGTKQSDPRFQATADALRDLYDDRLDQIQKRDPEFKGLEDYMGHAWKDPQKASGLIAEFLKRRPLAGNASFKKSRSFMTQEEGINAGLEPLTDNPVTMARLKLHAMDKWITAFDARQTLDDAHLLADTPKTGRLPEGMVQLNDPMFRGKMMNEEAASVLNNHVSPGIMGHPDFGGVMRGVRTAGNAMNQASLGISGIHALTSSINSAISEFAGGLRDLAPLAGFKGEAHPVEGVKKLANSTTLLGPAIRDYFAGTKIQKEWLHPGSTDSDTANIVGAMKQQGGRAFITSDYMTNMTDKMTNAFRQGNILGGILRAPMAGIEQAAKPIMEKMVPKLKLGAFNQVARAALRDNPNMSAEDLSKAMGDAWKSVDNRFGEMVHDNRFWNATARQLAQVSMRSVGWNYGTADELVGGAWDALKGAKGAVTGKGAEFTHRMAYSVGLPMLLGTWGAIMNYALTGKAPTSPKDLYAVPTGEKDKDGKDIRMSLPSYMRDVMSAGHDLPGTIANKMHPLISNTLELLNNKDYYGNKVYQEDDKGLKIAGDIAKHFGEGFDPLSIRQFVHGEGKSLPIKLSAMAGVNQSPKWLSTSEAEQEAYKPVEKRNEEEGGRTTAQQTKHTLTSLVRSKDPDAETKIQAALKNNEITPKDVVAIKKNAQRPGGLKGALESPAVDARYAMTKVFPKMTPEEIKENQFVLRRKLATANIPAEDKQKFRAMLDAAVKGK